MTISFIIKRPIITEKSLSDVQNGVFTFEVDKKATKIQVKKSIEEMFNVHVQAVRTVRRKGKKRLIGKRRQIIYGADIKIARVKLASDEKIDLFEVGGKK